MPHNGQQSPIQSILDTLNSATEAAAEQAAERTLEYLAQQTRKATDDLREKANNYLQSLLEKRNAVAEDRQRLHALIMEYNAKKSRFTQWSEWFSTLAWYEKMGYVVGFIAISALLGFAFNLAALFTLISIGISYVVCSLLLEHHAIASMQNNALIAGVTVMINNLVASIEQLTTLSEEVHAIQLELSEKCIQMEDGIQAFKAQMAWMEHEIELLRNETVALKQINDALICENEHITVQRNMAIHEAAKVNETFTEQSIQLSDIQQKLNETHQQLLIRNDELIHVRDQIKDSVAGISEIKNDFEYELTWFKSQRSQSDKTPLIPPDIEQQLSHSQDMLLQAEHFMRQR